MSEAPPRRFEMDAQAERATGRFRLIAAIVTLFAIAWLVLSDPSTGGWALAVIGGLVALGWLEAYRRSRRRAAEAASHYLELAREGLTLAEGDHQHHIAWADMDEVDVDDEKLVVSICRRGSPPLTIQPRYRGVSLEELAAAIRAGREGADGPEMVK